MAIDPQYYNLITSGIGYVSFIREVPVKQGNNFWSCALTAIHGKAGDPKFTQFDCRILGKTALERLKSLRKADFEQRKILVGFKIGLISADLFTFQDGPKKGQAGLSLKASLLFLAWIKVDGKLVYTHKANATKVA